MTFSVTVSVLEFRNTVAEVTVTVAGRSGVFSSRVKTPSFAPARDATGDACPHALNSPSRYRAIGHLCIYYASPHTLHNNPPNIAHSCTKRDIVSPLQNSAHLGGQNYLVLVWYYVFQF